MTSRSTAEWVGKTPDSEIPAREGSTGETKYIRADLVVRIPPEGPQRDEMVERMARAIYPQAWSESPHNPPTRAMWRGAARAALAALMGEPE